MGKYRSVNILLVEDNKMDEVLTLDAFNEARLQNDVHVVRNGEKALNYLLGEGEYADRDVYPLPDLILLDIKLPGITGHEVLAKIKKTPGVKRIPVIVLTSSKEEADLELSYDLGVNSYLVKPVSFDGFLSVVRQINTYWFELNTIPEVNRSK
jgi:CheY-like chemotaxis protein